MPKTLPTLWVAGFHALSDGISTSSALNLLSHFNFPHPKIRISHLPSPSPSQTQASAHRRQGQHQELQQIPGSARQSKCPEDHSFNSLRDTPRIKGQNGEDEKYFSSTKIWWLPKIGLPLSHPNFNRDFPYTPSILGYPNLGNLQKGVLITHDCGDYAWNLQSTQWYL